MSLVKVEKIQQRKLVLEEIESRIDADNLFIHGKWWREVKETDIHLHKEEPKLGLSVAECNGLFEGNQPAINKVKQFIRENS